MRTLATTLEMQGKVPAYVFRVLAQFNQAGVPAYLVGGCVRDLLLGRTPKDFDVTTPATPAEMENLFRPADGFRIYDIGRDYGTMSIIDTRTNLPVEATTYRGDGEYTDGRRPDSVQFGVTLADDLARRDFTVNAMAMDPKTGLIVDEFGGMDDLQAGVIRTVGQPEKRFGEDGLRILRALRFSAQLGFDIDLGAIKAMGQMVGMLEDVSAERVGSEISKMIMGNSVNPALYLAKILKVFPGVENEDLDHLPQSLAVRFAGLTRDMGDTERLEYMAKLRLPSEVITRASAYAEMSRDLYMINDHQPYQVRKSLSKIVSAGLDPYAAAALSGAPLVEVAFSCELDNAVPLTLADLAVRGKHVVEFLGKPGPIVGKVLRDLLDLVLVNPELNTREELLKHLPNVVAFHKMPA